MIYFFLKQNISPLSKKKNFLLLLQQCINYNISNKQQNFNGLWRQGITRSDIDPILSVPKVRDTFFYYPFSDEKPEEISAAVQKVNKAEFIVEDGRTKYYVRECRVGVKTPFTNTKYSGILS